MKKAFFKYFFALLLFGSNGIVASRIDLSSYDIVLLRTLIGSLLLTGVFFAAKGRPACLRHRRELLFIVVSGAAMGASWMLLYEAYARVGVSVASLLYYCGPVVVMALSPLLFRERLTLWKIIGFAAVLCGIFLVNGRALGGGGDTRGVFCGLMSAAMYAVMVIFNKKAVHILGMENSLIQLAVSFLTVAVFVGCKTGFALRVSAGDWPWILALGLINTGVGCWFYFSSIGALPVQTVAVCGYLEPLSAVVFSMLFLKEAMLPTQILGAALIIGGAVFGECAKSVHSK